MGLVRRDEVAPSGQRFVFHLATMAESLAALNGIPSVNVKESNGRSDRQGELAFSNSLLTACVEYPKLVMDGVDCPDDAIPVSMLRQCDVTWLLDRIQRPLDKDALAQAGRVLPVGSPGGEPEGDR